MTARSAASSRPRPAPLPRASGAIVLAIALASAAAAGAHELAWGRLLGRAVGNTSFGIGLTLALFMLGSGAGALLAPRLRWARARPRQAYVACEWIIAAGGAAVAAYCLYASPPSAWLALDGGAGLVADVVAAAAVTTIPALAIGACFPLLVACADAIPITRVYAAGLAGAVLGTLGGATLGAPAIGLDGIALVACGTNLAIGVIAARVLAAKSAPHELERSSPAERDATLRFAAAGALGLGAEVVWNRCLVPYAGVSALTFASIVSVYVLAQAAGFAVHERLDRREPIARVALAVAGPVALVSLAPLSPLGGVLSDRDAAPLAWIAGVLGVVLVAVGPTAFLLGLSQAGALAQIESDSARSARAGYVAGLGTMASAAATLLATFVLVPELGPRWTLAVLSGLAALALAVSRATRAWAPIALFGGALVAAWAPGPASFLGASFDDARVLHVDRGVQDTTAVVGVDRPVEPGIRHLVSNGVSYSGDSVFAQRYMRLLAHLPALAAEGEARALVICVGTGTTLDALRAYDFESIDAVDISEGVRALLPYFERVNHDAARDPRVELVIDDGPRFLRRNSRRYDVITLEPPPPRAPGASALYSVDFYEAARARLREGGAIAQWLPLHGMSSVEARAIVASFIAVFPRATLHIADRNEAILVGRTGALDAPRGARLARESVRADLARIGLDDEDPFTDSLLVGAEGLRAVARGGALVRDAWPLPEYAPLGGARARTAPLDRFVEALVDASTVTGSSAAALRPGIAPFVRIAEGNPEPRDRARVEAAMRAWLARDPSDPYVQHAFGFGPLLEERLDHLDAPARSIEAARARIAAQRRAFEP